MLMEASRKLPAWPLAHHTVVVVNRRSRELSSYKWQAQGSCARAILAAVDLRRQWARDVTQDTRRLVEDELQHPSAENIDRARHMVVRRVVERALMRGEFRCPPGAEACIVCRMPANNCGCDAVSVRRWLRRCSPSSLVDWARRRNVIADDDDVEQCATWCRELIDNLEHLRADRLWRRFDAALYARQLLASSLRAAWDKHAGSHCCVCGAEPSTCWCGEDQIWDAVDQWMETADEASTVREVRHMAMYGRRRDNNKTE
jgi:hypothetical protein